MGKSSIFLAGVKTNWKVSRIRVKRAICPLDNRYVVVGFSKRFKWEFKRTTVGVRNQLGNIARSNYEC